MWFRNPFGPRRTHHPGRRPAAGRLVVEALEDRSVPASLAIGDATLVEGDAGTQSAVLTVTLSGPVNPPVTVNYSTANGTALAGSDYQVTSGTLTFRKGETSKSILVPVIGDLDTEPAETFAVNLKGARHATIADARGVVTIQDDDTRLSIGDAAVTEGDDGTTAMTFTVALHPATDQIVTVDYATADGTALAGEDYGTAAGMLTFAPGQTSQTFTVLVNGDPAAEFDEYFVVNLSNPTGGAAVGPGSALGMIRNDDGVLVSVDGAWGWEGDTGSTLFAFTVWLSGPATETVTVDYSTLDYSATAGWDYLPVAGTLTFLPGETSKTVWVEVLGDVEFEWDETFFVALTGITGDAAIYWDLAAGNIWDDDPGDRGGGGA
jgi:Calx-beta domain